MHQAIDRDAIYVILLTNICLTCHYDLRCPNSSHWKTRAILKCGNITTYKCLYDDNNEYYVENCTLPDIEAPGYKLVWRRNLDRAFCKKNRYQPYIFYTTETSDCSLLKSKCSDEGQLVYDMGKTSEDIKCRCNSTLGYTFVNQPMHSFLCIPSTEDCTCYKKTGREPLSLSPVDTYYTQNQSKQDDWSSSIHYEMDIDDSNERLLKNSSSLLNYISSEDRTLRKIAGDVLLGLIIGAVLFLLLELYAGVLAKVMRMLESGIEHINTKKNMQLKQKTVLETTHADDCYPASDAHDSNDDQMDNTDIKTDKRVNASQQLLSSMTIEQEKHAMESHLVFEHHDSSAENSLELLLESKPQLDYTSITTEKRNNTSEQTFLNERQDEDEVEEPVSLQNSHKVSIEQEKHATESHLVFEHHDSRSESSLESKPQLDYTSITTEKRNNTSEQTLLKARNMNADYNNFPTERQDEDEVEEPVSLQNSHKAITRADVEALNVKGSMNDDKQDDLFSKKDETPIQQCQVA